MGKYKDEDVIIKALHNHHFITEVNGADWFDQIMNQVVDEIKNTPAVDIPRWIPVTERLPEEEGQYLVSGKWANKDEEVWICEFVRLCNIWGWCNEADRPVVQAWMPLPSPYKEGEEE